MSGSERYVQGHKRRTDCAIHSACVRLASDPPTFKKFQEMLACARKGAPRLFEAPFVDGRHLGVDALVNLSRFRGAHIRPLTDWVGTSSSWRPAISSLANHLICKYKVPTFLASSWYDLDGDKKRRWDGDKKRRWFVAHSRGASFRSLDLPILMTRKMEHIFLASQDHLSIQHAMRRAELLALGASIEVVKAVLSTQLASDLRNSEFWRTVWMFLIANAQEMDTIQIGPMIDFIQAVRHDRPQDRMVEFGPPRPTFSMKGRIVQSMLRLMKGWHGSLGAGSAAFSWARSPFQPMVLEEPGRDSSDVPRRWQMMELTDSAQLRSEGVALHHCVASYAYRCCQGSSRIWSLRLWQGETIRHVLTVEVDPKRRAVIQARGRANRAASGRSLRLLQDWAVRERLRMAI